MPRPDSDGGNKRAGRHAQAALYTHPWSDAFPRPKTEKKPPRRVPGRRTEMGLLLRSKPPRG